MSDQSKIAWTDATWNPVRGCTKVSAGCANCYAERFAERWRGIPGHPFEQGFDIRLVPEALNLPIRWRKPRRIFVNSVSDLFHPEVPFDYVDMVFGVMAACRFDRRGEGPGHVFQILTKRADRMAEYLSTDRRRAWAYSGAQRGGGEDPDPMFDQIDMGPTVLPHVWLGVSVENQAAADERIPHLLATPAAVRFVSCEPLLGPVDLSMPEFYQDDRYGPQRWVDWVIVGGESGPKARPCDVAWIRSIVDQTKAAGVPCFVKQMGADPIMEPGPISWPCEDRSGADPSEWPEDLRVQQMPGGER